MLAHHFRRGQIRTKAFGHNLALLLRCPNPTSLVPRDHLDTLTATTLMTYLMSVLSVGQGRSGREWQGRFHDQTPSQRLYPPQCVTAVSLTGRLEALHDPLSSSGRLVGILRPVVEAFVLAVLDAGHDRPLGGTVAAQLVGYQHTRRSPLLRHELAEQAFGGFLVAPALDQDIENEALLIDRAPEPVLLAGDGNDDLIQMPFVAAARGASTEAVGEFAAEFQAPLPDRLVGDRDAASRQHLLNHTQAQREAEIEPHRVSDEFGRVAIAGIERVSGCRHPARIPGRPRIRKAGRRST